MTEEFAPPPEPGCETPWYAEGLRFRCTACGVCCTGAPGYVWVTKDDLARLAQSMGLTPRRFRRRFARRAKGEWSLKERKNGDCVLLGSDGRCTVYEAKPTRCSTYPFWPEVLAEPAEWEYAARRCEGIGQGDLYVVSEIERLLAGDSRPLAAKHARGAPTPTISDRAADDAMDRALEDLERLYADLDDELPRYRFTCAASGRCCDFDAWGHRLYVSTIEAEYFFRHLDPGVSDGDPRRCPAQGARDRLCHAREGRMLGCRSYFCGPYPVAPPDEVYERYHRRLKTLHDRHAIPFAYRDLVDWARERAGG